MHGAEFPHLSVFTGADDPPTGDPVAAKRALRTQVLAARAARATKGPETDGTALAAHVLALPQVRAGACVVAYVSSGTEPPTALLLEELRRAGVRVLLPVLLADDDLDWAPYVDDRTWQTGRLGLREPAAEPLGVDAVAHADLVLLPGLAVSTTGQRMGRGGGSYDRALTRVPPGTVTAVLLHPEEVGLPVPVEPHDRPVSAAITRDGITWFTPSG